MSLSMPHRMLSWALARSRALKSVSPEFYLKAAAKIRNELDMVVAVQNRRGEVLIYCDSETVRQRAAKMPTREPATLAWVESFQPDDVMWDIGCNIGVFTLYAAVCSRARVIAFDPLPFNYAGLSRNLALNGVTDRVQAFCCALSDSTCVTTLYIPTVAYTPGGSGSTIGADPRAFGKNYGAEVSQAALQFSVDDLIAQFGLPVPNHLKLDIDGVQDKVILGARKTLRDPRLRSMMLELPPRADVIACIQHEVAEAGFILEKTVETAPGNGIDLTRVDTNHFYKRAG